MCIFRSRVEALAAYLGALTGREPRIRGQSSHARVEVDLPNPLPDEARIELLAALAAADRYGHDVTAEGASVWAEIVVRQRKNPGEVARPPGARPT
ncbi:hypothetical protein BJP40_09350 [Streptomyces sp. CC53]|uniref:hypothetical protein n=1 Tax=Streptomyces sp. CC53 TaxID=1906740 RepID=UPI0008DC9A9F|nr:hypothetical protein [Streptomyces sp. CC53]OII60625.1 hypothetical protein BJP40_09350 [Streptomyces sp. CC53]